MDRSTETDTSAKEALRVELAKLSTTFAEHVLDATNAFEWIVRDPAELAGLPPAGALCCWGPPVGHRRQFDPSLGHHRRPLKRCSHTSLNRLLSGNGSIPGTRTRPRTASVQGLAGQLL